MKKRRIARQDRQALLHQVPEFSDIMKQCDISSFECCEDVFLSLVRSILAQQLSVKAADTVFLRVRNFLGTVDAEHLLKSDPEGLRACGLSARKVGYLRGIAEAQLAGTLDFKTLAKQSDADVIHRLVQLRGVGEWTAEMLLIFSFGRPDILSFRDLGIRRGIMMLTGRDSLSEEEFRSFRRRCSPYGTLASLYLWRIKDGGLSVGEENSAPRSPRKKTQGK